MRAIFFVPVLLVPLLVPSAAEACRPGGGRVDPVVIQPVVSQSEILLQAIQQAETAASQQDFNARAAQKEARQHRTLAAVLRERARIFPDLDTRALLNQAAESERLARRADARAQTASARAAALRARAKELRLQLLGQPGLGHGRASL